ncbi:MAG: thiamine-phosphate kinase, partial [Pyrinomonadaceae bacterium]
KLDKIGDDCAVLPKDNKTDFLITSDMLVEDIDFRLEWTTPEFLGHKALAVSLSDIAAMGGNPMWSMLSIGLPKEIWETDFIDRFYAGWFDLADQYRVALVGGDVSRSTDKLVIDSTVGGEVAHGKAIMRSTAKAGDAIFVTGKLGGAAGGLKLLENGFRYSLAKREKYNDLLLKQLKPHPQLLTGKLLGLDDIASTMIDLSDGLSSDLHHLCRQSTTGAKIEAGAVPIHPDLCHFYGADDCLAMAVNGGEDFELLFTVEEKNISRLETLDVTRIGMMTANIGTIEITDAGKTTVLPPIGYRHF